uniref:Uncharacterized protein n=1 Tax=Tetranychus urticae TaxID=32264 RepID=T1K767_TETUR
MIQCIPNNVTIFHTGMMDNLSKKRQFLGGLVSSVKYNSQISEVKYCPKSLKGNVQPMITIFSSY